MFAIAQKAGRVLVVAIAACAAVLSGGAAHADPGERITAYDVAVAVRADGTAHVRETIAYDFGANAKHGIDRKILYSKRVRTDTYQNMDVSNVRVSSPDAPARADVSRDGTYTEVRVGDPDRTVTGTHTYTIAYDTDHVATKAGGGVRYAWNAVGDEWPVPVSHATVTLTGPARMSGATCFAGASGGTTPCASARSTGHRARFTQASLDAGDGLTVRADLPAGSVAVAPKYQHIDHTDPFGEKAASPIPSARSAIGVAVLLLIALGVYVYARRRRAAGADRPPLPGLPDGLTPGLAAYAADGSGERGMIVGTLLDLARRGYLRVDDIPGRGPDWLLARTAPWDPALAPHEQALLRGLFGGRDQVAVSRLRNRFRASVRELTSAITADARRRGWVREPYVRWIVSACAAPFALLAFMELTSNDSEGWPFVIVASVLVVLAIVQMLAPTFRFTAAGQDARRQVRALRDQLADPMAGAQVDPEWALPYAAAFNLAPTWEAAMANGAVRRVGWYTGIGIAAFTTAAGTYMISAPSSGSGGGSISAGGGGFSGGSVGGGGGGGGGGSW